MDHEEKDVATGRGVSRRTALKVAGFAGAGAALGAGGYSLGHAQACQALVPVDQATVAFYGEHQAGIATPAPEHLHFATFDLVTNNASDVRDLFRLWSGAAARLTAGETTGVEPASAHLPPTDTGEALGHPPARLTLTFGFGPTLFTKDGVDRYGLAAHRPAALVDLPTFRGDVLQPERSGGDICVQACAEDPQVAFHAVRNLARLARGLAVMRWSQLGFSRTSSTSAAQQTPRNLMGFKDGTNNLKAEDTSALQEAVWVSGTDDPAWMRGGSYLVARRIRMLIESWDRTALDEQERVIGRHKAGGAPLSTTNTNDEFATLDLTKKGANDKPLIDVDAHSRLAHRENVSQRILRRGYSFTDGMDQVTGQLDAGLFFICFQQDPRRQFIPIQQQLAQIDALNEYIKHTGSAIFACPPGTSTGGYIGETLFADI
jgi:deferrochelatase/peroxidase EfeB